MTNEDGEQMIELQEYLGHKTDEIVEDGFPEDKTKKPRIKEYSDGRGGVYQQYVFDFTDELEEDQVVPI